MNILNRKPERKRKKMDNKDLAKQFTVVCKCRAVNYKTIISAIKNGADSLEKVRSKTKANTGCRKKCTRKILEMLEQKSQS